MKVLDQLFKNTVPEASGRDAWQYTKIIGGAAIVGTGVTAAVSGAIGAIGFTATGIAAGSIAAKMMSVSAVASGGGVPAGGVVATLTSVGMTGLGAMVKTTIGGTAGAIYSYFSAGRKD